MIFATIRQLNIYRDHDIFTQAGRFALWQAWTRYDEGKGHFAPYASRSIRGAMLDELTKETHFEDHVGHADEESLEYMNEMQAPLPVVWSDRLEIAFELLTPNEKELIQLFYIDRLTQAQCAERIGLSVAGIKKRRERLLIKLKTIIG